MGRTPTGNPNGRPTKLTNELQDEIVKYLKMGNYVETVSHLVGITSQTFHDWLRQGAKATRKSNRMYKFSYAVKAAMAYAEMTDLAMIQRATIKHWQAAAWRLARRVPSRFGLKAMVGTFEIPDGPDNRPDLKRLDVEDLESLEGIMSKASGEESESGVSGPVPFDLVLDDDEDDPIDIDTSDPEANSGLGQPLQED